MFDISSPADDQILVYDSVSSTFKVEDNVSGFTGDLAGNVLYDSTGDVVVEDKMIVKANSTDDRNISLGDETFGGPNYLLTNLKIDGQEERWAWITLDEHTDGPFPKTIAGGNFSNPLIISRIQGGTPGSEVGVAANRRIFGLQATVGYDSDGAGTDYVLPTSASFRFQAEVTENQRTTARGSKVYFDTIANGSTATTRGLQIQGDTVTITPNGDGTIDCGGDLTIQANGGSGTVTIPGLSSSGQVGSIHTQTLSAGGTWTPDYDDGNWQFITITTSSTIELQRPSNMPIGGRMDFLIYSNGVLSTLTQPSSPTDEFLGWTQIQTDSGTYSRFYLERWSSTHYTAMFVDDDFA
jgi:hypothetical protein